jgi:hypothetical protein
MRCLRRIAVLAVAVIAAPGLASCDDDGSIAAPPTTAASGHAIATFEVRDETFKIELATPELVDHAERLLAGENVSAIPLGTVVRGDPGPNAPWTWHIDPTTVQFADMTIGVCDGLPSYVEDNTVTGGEFCPWSAKVVAVDPVQA